MFSRVFRYPCSSQFSCYSQGITLAPGEYFIECWGASGGEFPSLKGGRGSYVSGTVQFRKRTKLFLFIGAQGSTENNKSSFNGGGTSSLLYKSGVGSGGGGGGTDIRLENKTDISGLKSRIIVASGGGGSALWGTGSPGGNGGELQGLSGISYKGSDWYELSVPTGGTQNSGGKRGECITHPNKCLEEYHGSSGVFGSGGRATLTDHGGGGGGGYFGGGGGSVTHSQISSGGGGSSFISGHDGCIAVDPQSTSLTSPQMLPHSYHSSGIKFKNTTMKGGDKPFYNYDDTPETGHSGNGAIKITIITSYCITQAHHHKFAWSFFLTLNIIQLS